MKKLKQEEHEQKKKPVLKTGQILDLAITGLDDDGFGTAVHESKLVRVAGTMPGEMVRAKITFSGQRDTFAEPQKILRRSPDRLVTPPCTLGAACDGCPLMVMRYSAQLAWKKSLVTGAMRRYPSLRATEIRDVLPSAKPLAYRTTAKLVIAGRFLDPVIGIYRRNSHDVMDIGQCPLHHPLINRIAAVVKEGIRKCKVPVYSPRTRNGLLRYLVVRVSENENSAMVTFVTSSRSFNEIHHLAKHLQQAVPEVAVVVQNVNSSAGNVILGDQDHFVTKKQNLTESIGPVKFTVSPRSFFQVNNDGAHSIYEQVRAWSGLTGTETVVDLYCGVGGISLYLADKARQVTGFEVVDSAVGDAERNARLNGIKNCRFEAGDAAHLLEDLREEGKPVDLVVLNPPRKGCDAPVLASVAALAPERIIYVSCSPATLARDLDVLADAGYRALTIQPVDMFPQTPHVENVALLEKN